MRHAIVKLHCPRCGTPFVRVTRHQGALGRVLNCIKIFPFRCQLCAEQFHAFWCSSPNGTQWLDRRQFRRLPASFRAHVFTDKALRSRPWVTDISMAGCTIETPAAFPTGTFLELVIKPASEPNKITIRTAMVCTTRPASMGVRFLEFEGHEKTRLSQVVLNLLVGQNLHSSGYS